MTLSTFENNPWLMVKPSIGMSLIDHLFNKLDGMYTGKWRAAFSGPSGAIAIANWKAAWAEALVERRISPEQVKRGLTNCLDMYDWPPSLTEFIKACKELSRDEQVTPPEAPALGYDFKHNPELAAQASKAVNAESRTDHTAWIRRVWAKGERNVSPMAWRMANDAAREFGITK